jgi:hypothetical protein
LNATPKPSAPKSARFYFLIFLAGMIVGVAIFMPGFALTFATLTIVFINIIFFMQGQNIAREGPFYCKLPDLPDGSSAWQTCSWKRFTKCTFPPGALMPGGGIGGVTILLTIFALRDNAVGGGHHLWPFVAVLTFIALALFAKRQVMMISQFGMARLVSGGVQNWAHEQIEAGKAKPLPMERNGRIFFSLPPVPSGI